MESENIIDVLMKAETLKCLNRTGWALAGVGAGEGETVAAHSYGTALAALLIAQKMHSEGSDVNTGQVLAMAIIHDLPESYISDIPGSVIDIAGNDMHRIKLQTEGTALDIIFQALGNSILSIRKMWDELQKKTSLESRIVAAADIIDMLVHGLVLEKRGVSPIILDSFFIAAEKKIQQLNLETCTSIFKALVDQHQINALRLGLNI